MTSMTVHPLIKSPIDAPPQSGRRQGRHVALDVDGRHLPAPGDLGRDPLLARMAVLQPSPRKSEATPFPLAELPRTAATWQASEGSDVQLDLDVARIAGSSDHIVRSYLDEKTGEQASVLLLYGLAAGVFGHTPEVCYPAAGYQARQGSDRWLDRGAGREGPGALPLGDLHEADRRRQPL